MPISPMAARAGVADGLGHQIVFFRVDCRIATVTSLDSCFGVVSAIGGSRTFRRST